jgi:hypothetical protein
MDNPFTITVYDKAFVRQGWVNDPIAVQVIPRHNAVGTATITVTSNHRKLDALIAPGARVVIEYKGEHAMSGYITKREGQGPITEGTITLTVSDDLWLIWRMLGWPVPGALLTAQGVKEDSRTGAAETVAKAFITANLAHNTVDPITVATNQARGSSIGPIKTRMAILADVLMTAVDGAGIGLQARQVGNRIVLDAYVPRTFPHTLSELAGTVLSWTWSNSDPTITRAIIGGPNENTSREFRQVVGTATETLYGYTVEGFADARSAINNAEIDAAGTTALTEGMDKRGFAVVLSESKVFHYGDVGVRVGDKVTISIGDRTMTDVLREATLTFDRDNGMVITPVIGERTDDPDRNLASFIGGLARGIRDLRTR